MSLPKSLTDRVKAPRFDKKLPVSGVEISYRPYTVGDEKLLLAAAAGRKDNPQFYISNTLQVIRSCINDKGGLLETLPSIDVEYLLLQIKAKSVSEIVEVKHKSSDGKTIVLKINLENIEVENNDKHIKKIELTDNIGLMMKELSFVDKMSYATTKEEDRTSLVYQTIVDCVDAIYDENGVYKVGTNVTKADVKEFIEGLTGVSTKLYEFIGSMPQLAVDGVHPDGVTVTRLIGSEIDFLAS